MNFKNKLVIVTGSGSGIGASVAKTFAKQEATVIICDINLNAAKQTTKDIIKDGGKAFSYQVDVADLDAVITFSESIEKEHGSVHVLVNNAGVSGRNRQKDAKLDDLWKHVIDINLYGIRNMCHAFTPALKKSIGCIVNFASIVSFKASGSSTPAYIASKGAVSAYTKALARDLGQFGIRVNAVAPGVIKTELLKPQLAVPGGLDWFTKHSPLKRGGEPEELAGPVLFLASPLASFVNGVILPVDGGFLAQ